MILWPRSHMRSSDKRKAKFLLLHNACTTKLGRIKTYNKGNSPLMSHDPLTMWSHEVRWQIKSKISPLLQGQWPPNCDHLWWGKLTHNDPLITWSRKVTWKIKNLISPLPQGIWPPNMASWGLTVRRTYLWSHMIIWERSDVWSRDKLKA